ncbi:MAG: GNAT family N-acetyltransferase, partial [Promethearchaeota archaeon]
YKGEAKYLEEGSFVAWLAQEGEDIIGTSGICFYSVPPTFGNPSGDVAYIMNMWTRLDWRRQGIGQSLLDKLLEEASRRGIRKVLLDTTDIGRSLYAKNGFVAIDNEMMRMLD